MSDILVLKTILQQNEPGLLEEMAGSRAELGEYKMLLEHLFVKESKKASKKHSKGQKPTCKELPLARYGIM